MTAQIIGVRGPLAGQSFVLTETPLLFGRDTDCAVRIASKMASRRHAEIRQEQVGFVLYDCRSHNSTLLNGAPIHRRLLRPDDEISIGAETFRFVTVAEAHTQAPALEIVGLHGPQAGRRFPLDDTTFSFGREGYSNVPITSRMASRHHAEICHEANGYMLYDRKSVNGTLVNGERIKAPQLLLPGDEIAIGDEVFRIDIAAADPDRTQIPLPVGTITFLFTDIEGSAQLWDQHRVAMRRALARHDAIIEECVAQHTGCVVRPRGEGDSRFAVFARAIDAVAAACAIQRALFAEAWTTPTPLRVRVGLLTGEATIWEGDYYGTDVNRCARIRGLAGGGQTLISLTTMSLTVDRLPTGVTLRDCGWHSLKGVAQPEHLFQLNIPGLPEREPEFVGDSARSFEPPAPVGRTSTTNTRDRIVRHQRGSSRATTVVFAH